MFSFPKPKTQKSSWRSLALLALVFLALPVRALPARLVLAMDGIAYRDVAALQAGVERTNFFGKKTVLRAFTADEGYFPVSRMISTFPSLSDIAWTDIFGDRPLPGYQRIYFSAAANAEIFNSGISTTMEYERQMDWQVESGFRRGLGYIFPAHAYAHEVREMTQIFWNTASTNTNYYAYIRASDDAQHLDRDISAMLYLLDQALQELRARYRAREGRDLQIVILSDHGHNHAGRGRRVAVRSFLEQAGYRVAESIANPKDVVLPDGGIENWVEIHNAPAETEKLTEQLCHLEGADILAARLASQPNRFLVLNAKSERAVIDWSPEKNSFRYIAERGDPLNYLPVVKILAGKIQLDAAGFAAADDWFAATAANHYPNALERIVFGFTRNTLNPANILISLDNRYVNAGWLVQQGSRLVTCGSTHGGLDDVCSDGILLSNFQPTRDTSTARVAAQFENFPGVKNFRAEESGAEWFVKNEQAQVRIQRRLLDTNFTRLPDGKIFLRVWSPEFTRLSGDVKLETTIEKADSFAATRIRRSDSPPPAVEKTRVLFSTQFFPADFDCERIYALPENFVLAPRTEYKISGSIAGREENLPLFVFNFRTDSEGRPIPF
jgi:Type I phosphodiesterase / nucleotide pyrophosphatase